MSTEAQPKPVFGQVRDKPFTSAEFLESLRDGREIWIYGERVKDVTTHPAFRNTSRMLARLYDALHDERKSRHDTHEQETETGRAVGEVGEKPTHKPRLGICTAPGNPR